MVRPTKLTKDIEDKAEEYLETAGECAGDVVPSAVGLARYMGISRSTLYLWVDKYEWLSDTLSIIDTEQHRKLLNGGLSGDYNSAIAKLMLANHGYSDKVDQTLSGGDKPIETKSSTWIYEAVEPETAD